MSGKKVLVISSSPRRRGNSDQLADAFIEGAQEAGHIVEKISLHDKQIGFCKGCLGCQKTQHCILRDDMDDILPRMQQAEVIAFASPVYFYSLCGQWKAPRKPWKAGWSALKRPGCAVWCRRLA